jgi:hypothetical protein
MRYSLTDYNTGNNRLKLIWCVVRKGQYRIHLVPHLSYTALSFSHFTTYKTFLYYFFQCDVSISLEISTVFNVDGISFSRFVKTTLHDELCWLFRIFIGHSGSTYWRKKNSEKAEIFRKIEPYVTFLNIHQLERQDADIRTKVEELEELNQSLRQRDKVKDDAIAQLSDQLVSLSARLQEIERRHSLILTINEFCLVPTVIYRVK